MKTYKGMKLTQFVFAEMNLRVISIADNAIQIQLDKEDYSIADIVHRELLNVKHVKFTGVPPPHPLIKTLTLQVHTDGASPSKVVKEALELAQTNVDQILNIAKENFPKDAPSPNSAQSQTVTDQPKEATTGTQV